jgi:hypothetical protein
MLMFISIFLAIFIMVTSVTAVEYLTKKSDVLKPKQFTIKEKIRVPVVGTVILYDFDRDVNGKVRRDDVLSTAFMLVLMDKNGTGEQYVTLDVDEADGEVEFVFDRDSVSASDMIKLMSVSTNVNFAELQLLNEDATKRSIPNPVRQAFTADIMVKVQTHVHKLLDEAVALYVERYIEFANNYSEEEEE